MYLKGLQSAVVVIKDKNGKTYQDSSIGTGSIVSIYNAVDRIFQRKTELIDYRLTQSLKVQMRKQKFTLV